jgi:hypothetical protein
MDDHEERAEAFLKETLVHFDTLHKGVEAYARSHPTSTELLALSIRSLPVTEKHIHASIERSEQRQRAMYDDDARSRKRWAVGRSDDRYCYPKTILLSLCNIAPRLLYWGVRVCVARSATGGCCFWGLFCTSHARSKRAPMRPTARRD